MFSNSPFVLLLLRGINDHCNDLPLYSRQIWPGQSQAQQSKIIDHLDLMINENLIEGISSEEAQAIGSEPDVQINNITWEGKDLLNKKPE